MNATEVVIYIFRKTLTTFLDTLDIGGGVTIGWIIIGVSLIGMLISTILSRPISGKVINAGNRERLNRNKEEKA